MENSKMQLLLKISCSPYIPVHQKLNYEESLVINYLIYIQIAKAEQCVQVGFNNICNYNHKLPSFSQKHLITQLPVLSTLASLYSFIHYMRLHDTPT